MCDTRSIKLFSYKGLWRKYSKNKILVNSLSCELWFKCAQGFRKSVQQMRCEERGFAKWWLIQGWQSYRKLKQEESGPCTCNIWVLFVWPGASFSSVLSVNKMWWTLMFWRLRNKWQEWLFFFFFQIKQTCKLCFLSDRAISLMWGLRN